MNSVTRTLRRLLPGLALLATAAHAASGGGIVLCHVSYGGETQTLRAAPSREPYTVAPVAIGSYFQFRVVFEHPSLPRPGIKIYTYAEQENDRVPIHVAHFPFPPTQGARFGFTGEQFVYEPMRDGELSYWCELKRGRR